MDGITLVKSALAVWYLSYVITATHGPGGIFEWVREHVWHGRTKIAVPASMDGKPYVKWEWGKNGLLDCFFCTSVWVAAILALAGNGIALDILAAAGLAGLLHGYTGYRFGG